MVNHSFCGKPFSKSKISSSLSHPNVMRNTMSERERLRQQSWVSRREAAEQFGVAVRTIMRWEIDQKLGFPKPKVVRGRVYFLISELDAFQQREHAKESAC
jgi:hypothetical protein